MTQSVLYQRTTWFCMAFLGVGLGFASETALPMHWHLEETEVKQAIAQVAEITGRTFILEPGLKGTLSVVAPQVQTPDSLHDSLISALKTSGFCVQEEEGIFKIFSSCIKPLPAGTAPSSQRPIKLFSFQNIAAEEVMNAVRPWLSTEAQLMVNTRSNSLMVCDDEEHLAELEAWIATLEAKKNRQFEIVPLKHATAVEVVKLLLELNLLQGQSPIFLSADEHNNQILIHSYEWERQELLHLIDSIDIPQAGDSMTEVVYLRYQNAQDLIPALQQMLNQYQQLASVNRNAFNNVQPGVWRNTATNAGRATPPSVNVSDSNTVATAGVKREAAGAYVGPLGVQAEPHTNALIITAPASLMKQLKSLVQQLDVKRAQVLVEATIAEVSVSQQKDIGTEWRLLEDPIIGAQLFETGRSLTGGFLPILQDLLVKPAGTAATAGGSLGFVDKGAVKLLLHALSLDSQVNILSSPSVVVLDNVEACIRVVKVVPFPVGQYATTNDKNTVNPFVTTEYRNVGLELRVLPQITQGDTIQLTVSQTVDGLGPALRDGPTTDKRELQTTVLVKDGQMLVLGGLIRQEEKKQIEALPLLGRLPLFGPLFRRTVINKEKNNLMIFLRPIILKENDTDSWAQARYERMRGLNPFMTQQLERIPVIQLPQPWISEP